MTGRALTFTRLLRGPAAALCCALAACGKPAAPPAKQAAPVVSGPLQHSAYVWQREWTPAVREAVTARGRAFQSLAVLGAQISTAAGRVEVVRPAVDWKALAASGTAAAAVIRLEKPLPADPAAAALTEARRLIAHAAAAGLTLAEIQVDYDSPQKKLAAYTPWLRQVERALEPLPVRLTTLASWLAEPQFPALLDACDGWILQVHSFDPPAPGKRASVCDPDKVRAWVQQAAAHGRPFTVALPTYRTTAGYDAAGKLVGVATDSVTPAWPQGSVREEFPAPAAALAALIAEWTCERPAALRDIIWYRLPVATDTRNWRWEALAAVMSGRPPLSRMEVKITGTAPLDVVLSNTGDQDEWLPPHITLTWPGAPPAAGDALGGWSLTTDSGRARFSSTQPAGRLLAAGKSTALGWLRFHEPAPAPNTIHSHLDPPAAPAPRDR